jgi:hypothetical protein
VPSKISVPWLALLLPALAALAPGTAAPQPPQPPEPSPVALLKQERVGAPAVPLTSAELAALGDPLFNLVLREHAGATTLAQVESLLRLDNGTDNRRLFVVDENVADATPAGSRRAVIAFTGVKGGQNLAANVMLSMSFRPDDFPDSQRIEAWGWDDRRGRYNYYVLDTQGTPDRLSWKFRGSSDGADLLTAEERRGTCLQCHVNGAPVMKELAQPWNNWHSQEFAADYLTATAPVERRWPVASHPRLSVLREAQDLERSFLLGAIGRFNNRRINDALQRSSFDGAVEVNSRGFARVLDGRRLLRLLFVTTEVNFVSSEQTSGLHRFTRPAAGGADDAADAQKIELPNDLFLNASLIGGNPNAGFKGLDIDTAHKFGQVAQVTKADYQRVVTESGVELGGQPGDTQFAWFVPGPSHVDTDMAVRLMQRGLVPPRFLAALAAVDLENPVFSPARAALLALVPNTFRFKPLPRDADPLAPPDPGAEPADGLVPQVIVALEAAQPAAGSPAALLLERLKSADPVALLRQDVEAYHARIQQAFSTPATQEAEVRRLQQVVLERRRAVLQHAALSGLEESMGRLLPLPPAPGPP